MGPEPPRPLIASPLQFGNRARNYPADNENKGTRLRIRNTRVAQRPLPARHITGFGFHARRLRIGRKPIRPSGQDVSICR